MITTMMVDTMEFAEREIYAVTIDAPIQVVWDTLVKTDEALPFFFGAVCDTKDGLKSGASMRMITPNGKFASVVGEVLEFSPPHRYAHTMQFTQYDDGPCTVTYELSEVDGGTLFKLITENVPAGTKTEKSMASGGPFITANLKSLVETGRPKLSGRMVMTLGPLLGLVTPKRSRIENWPL
ncbi:MAG: SRPBCC domain-containing protein [Pseudomonadota bacterium]